jgi:hypothetical protein
MSGTHWASSRRRERVTGLRLGPNSLMKRKSYFSHASARQIQTR